MSVDDTESRWTLGTNHIEYNVLACRCRDEAGKSSNEGHGVQEARIDDDLEQGAEWTFS